MEELQKRNTKQRRVVEEIVLSSCEHPTAEAVYQKSREELPSISLGTVYRILHELAADGKIREIPVPDAPSRFDKTLGIHAHMYCEKCGCVCDVDMCGSNLLETAARDNPDKKLIEAEVMFKGLCSKCMEEI